VAAEMLSRFSELQLPFSSLCFTSEHHPTLDMINNTTIFSFMPQDRRVGAGVVLH
jgi:hypothetical protein